MKSKFRVVMRFNVGVIIFLIMLFTVNLVRTNAVDQYVAKVNSTMYSDYKQAWKEAMDSGEELVMIANWKIDGVLTIDENKSVNLNMNGYMIDRGRTSSTSSGQVFLVKKSSTLHISGGGNREHKGLILSTGVWKSNEKGLYSIFGSLITGGFNSNGGGAFQIQENATVNLNGVTIAGNATSDSSGGGAIRLQGSNSKLYLDCCSILYNKSTSGGGAGIVAEGENSYVEIKNTSIMHNLTDGSNSDGGAIQINNGEVVVSNNSEISYNKSTRNGGGICINKGNLIISDNSVKFSYNTSNKEGGAVYVNENSGEVVLSGNFVGNVAGEEGGAIYVNHDLITYIKDSKFYGNIADNAGGAIYVESDDFISLEGTISMSGNTPNSLYLNNPENLANVMLGDDSLVGLDTSFEVSNTNPLTLGVANVLCFVSDRDGYKIKIADVASIYFAEDESETPTSYKANGYTYSIKSGQFTYGGKDAGYLKAKYYYSDGYFAETPVFYNEHLATMSMNLTLSGMMINYTSSDQYSEEIGSKNAVELLERLGFTNIYVHYPFPEFYGIDEDIISTIGYIIASKTININGEDITLIAVVVRGGGYGAEWTSNIILGDGVGEAKGFSNAADQVEKGILEYLSTYNIEGTNTKFWLTGFSRSAAVANLTSKRLTDKFGTDNIYAYCFETPKGGTLTEVNKDSDYTNIHNIISGSDIVTLVATAEMGFIRYGIDHLIPAHQVDSDEYNTQKDKMLAQLSELNSTISYKDNYHAATLEYFWSYIGTSNLISEIDWDYSNVADFLPFFVSEIQKRSLTNTSKDNEYNRDSKDWQGYRYYYSTYKWYLKIDTDDNYDLKIISHGEPPADYVGNEDKYIVLTFEKAIANLMSIYYTMSDLEKNSIMSNIDIDYIKEKLDMYDIWTEVIDEWEHMSLKNKNKWLIKIWNAISRENIPNISLEKENRIQESLYVVLDVLLDFVAEDYQHNDQNGVGTFVYNVNNVLQNHYQDVVAAWVRSYDSFYIVDYKAPPLEPSTNIEIGIYNESLEVKLSSDENAKIYYTLDGTLPVVGNENTFEYNESINLLLVDSRIKMYVINAISIANDVKSEVSTFYYYISDINEFTTELNVSDITYGDELLISIESKFDEAIYLYSSSIDGEFSETIPTEPGTYYVKALVEGSEYYETIESEIKSFKINKIKIDLNNLSWSDESFIYDGTNKVVTLNGIESYSNLIIITYENNKYTIVGNYTTKANVTLVDPDYYVLINEDNLIHEWKIEVANNEFLNEISLDDWEYGQPYNEVRGSSKFGEVIFVYSDNVDGEYSENIPVDSGVYYVKGIVLATDNYTGLESEPVQFTITKANNELITNITIMNWEYGQVNSVPQGKSKFGELIFTYSNTIDGIYTLEVPTTPGRYYLKAYVDGTDNYNELVTEPIEFEIMKNINRFTVNLTVSNFSYSENLNIEVSALYGDVNLLYSTNINGEFSTTIPVDAGIYFVKAVVVESLYYTGLESEILRFEILKATNEFIEEVTITSWVYNEESNLPKGTSKYGEVKFAYSTSIDGEYNFVVPVNAGVYYLKAYVDENLNYTSLEKIIEFKIEKANPIITIPTGLTAKKGSDLSSVDLPSNWKWNSPTTKLTSVGKIQVEATYTPNDINNYNCITTMIEIDVKPNRSVMISLITSIAIVVGMSITVYLKKKREK